MRVAAGVAAVLFVAATAGLARAQPTEGAGDSPAVAPGSGAASPGPAPAAAQPSSPGPHGYPPPYGHPAPYGHPPPYGYPLPYGYPPPYGQPQPYGVVAYAPGPAPKPPKDPEAARLHTPFFDVLVAGLNWNRRLSHFLNVGLQVGHFASRARLSARVLFFTEELDDEYRSDTDFTERDGLDPVPSPSPTVLFGGSLGYAVASTSGFVLSPSVAMQTTDEGAYGSFLGLALPFEWVTEGGVRVGFEFALGRSFGGSVELECRSSTLCAPGDTERRDRQAGTAFTTNFQVGWGLAGPSPR